LGSLAGGWSGRAGRPAAASSAELRPGGAGFAEAVARLGAMPLDRFEREGQLLEIRVPWHAETLWLVPAERDAEALGREGVSRGRVWTARELTTLMALPNRTPSVVQTLAHAKCAVDGDIVETRQR